MDYYERKARRNEADIDKVIAVMRWILALPVAIIGWILGPEGDDE